MSMTVTIYAYEILKKHPGKVFTISEIAEYICNDSEYVEYVDRKREQTNKTGRKITSQIGAEITNRILCEFDGVVCDPSSRPLKVWFSEEKCVDDESISENDYADDEMSSVDVHRYNTMKQLCKNFRDLCGIDVEFEHAIPKSFGKEYDHPDNIQFLSTLLNRRKSNTEKTRFTWEEQEAHLRACLVVSKTGGFNPSDELFELLLNQLKLVY